jgi:hypothetical protein
MTIALEALDPIRQCFGQRNFELVTQAPLLKDLKSNIVLFDHREGIGYPIVIVC